MRHATQLHDAAAAYQHAAEVGSELERQKLERKIKEARERHRILVFLSHKQKDYEAANIIRESFRTSSAGRADVFMSESITKGDDWQEKIEQTLYEADWFFLLFSGVDEDWSWCHHEAGIFRGMMYPNAQRVVVLHPPNVDLPSPLKKYQSVRCVEATPGHPDELDDFLAQFFGEPTYPDFEPINTVLAESGPSRQRVAKILADAVGRLVVRTLEPDSVLRISVPDISQMSPAGFPEGTEIRDGSSALRLFDLGDDRFPWTSFLSILERERQGELSRSLWSAVYEACAESIERRRVMPAHAVFKAADGRHYRPVLNRIEINGDNSATFRINFVQVASANQAEVRDKSVARVFTALNLAHRFRWEVIDPYRNEQNLWAYVQRVRSPRDGAGEGNAADAESPLAALWETITLIENEAVNRGVYDPEGLPDDFGDAGRSRVKAMFPIWADRRRELEEAAQTNDVERFAKVLKDVDPINVEFISMAAERLSELVRADARS